MSMPEATILRPKFGGVTVEDIASTIDWVKILIYGDPGVGKTFLAGTAQDLDFMSPVLWIDLEGGTKTIRQRTGIDVIRVKDAFEGQQLKQSAWRQLFGVYEDLRKGVMKYKTTVVDSLFEGNNLSLTHALQIGMKKALQMGREHEGLPEQKDWGRSRNQMLEMIRSFRDLDCHVIFTALADEIEDSTTGSTKIRPAFPGKLAKELPAFLDEICYLYVKEKRVEKQSVVERKLLCQPTGRYLAKDRSGRLPSVMDDPTMAKIAELVLD